MLFLSAEANHRRNPLGKETRRYMRFLATSLITRNFQKVLYFGTKRICGSYQKAHTHLAAI